MDNISKINHNRCTGCMLCYNICPKKCISIDTDSEGFIIPKINYKECVECGICLKNCPSNSKPAGKKPFKAYALQVKNVNELLESSSGGVAYSIAKTIISSGGVAYGARFDSNFNLSHSRASTIQELNEHRGSKYLQSNISECLKSLKEDCETGTNVVFVGTPCQIAAVKKYLKKDYNNLLLIDLICHGVPSQSLFKDYIEWKKRKLNLKKVLKYEFRNKKYGWATNYKIEGEHKAKYGSALEDPYYSDFIGAKNYRLSCYTCNYANLERQGDLTIGDYWGISKIYKNLEFEVKNGVSCVLVNTKKGNDFILNNIKQYNCVDSKIEDIVENNGNLREPAHMPEDRKDYYKNVNYNKKNIILKFKLKYYKSKINRLLPSKIKKIIKKIIKGG